MIVRRIDSILHSKGVQRSILPPRRVAAYVRVSTASPDQLLSQKAQVDYFTHYIRSRENWIFAGIYTDEGISGTSIRQREGFTRLVQDATNGKIDLIVTKSLSRFARNTVDTLTTIRELKEHSVEVYFEKENLYTFDSKGEIMITILSSLAQEESRSISENISWGIRKRMADGKINLPYESFLGYVKGSNGRPQIVEEEAAIVRYIYGLFIKGFTPHHIAKLLETEHISSPSGKPRWWQSVIESILTNEKYMGDALLQKSYTLDFLSKRKKLNKGELPQYYIKRSHPAIISEDVFLYVQEEIKRRGLFQKSHYCTPNSLSSKIVCGICGSYYGSRIWHATDKYRSVVWQCRNRWRKGSPCQSPHLYDVELKAAFMKMVAALYTATPSIRETCRQIAISTIGSRYEIRHEQASAFFDDKTEVYDFDEELFCSLVSQVNIESTKAIMFRLRSGSEIHFILSANDNAPT